MQLAIDIASGALVLIGSFFVLAGGLAFLRLPDIYTRVHGASVIDTAGAGFIIAGMMIQTGFSLVTLKLLFILAIFLFTLPVAAHALAQAAMHEGIEPQLAEDRRGRKLEEGGEGGTP